MRTDLNFEAESFAGYRPYQGEEPEYFHSHPGYHHHHHGHGGYHGGGCWHHGGYWRGRQFYPRWPWLYRGGYGGFGGVGGFDADSQTVSWAQGCLAQLVGSWVPQDGMMGPSTRRALRMFQSQ